MFRLVNEICGLVLVIDQVEELVRMLLASAPHNKLEAIMHHQEPAHGNVVTVELGHHKVWSISHGGPLAACRNTLIRVGDDRLHWETVKCWPLRFGNVRVCEHCGVDINQLCGCIGDHGLLARASSVHDYHRNSGTCVVWHHLVKLAMLHLHVTVIGSNDEDAVVEL